MQGWVWRPGRVSVGHEITKSAYLPTARQMHQHTLKPYLHTSHAGDQSATRKDILVVDMFVTIQTHFANKFVTEEKKMARLAPPDAARRPVVQFVGWFGLGGSIAIRESL